MEPPVFANLILYSLESFLSSSSLFFFLLVIFLLQVRTLFLSNFVFAFSSSNSCFARFFFRFLSMVASYLHGASSCFLLFKNCLDFSDIWVTPSVPRKVFSNIKKHNSLSLPYEESLSNNVFAALAGTHSCRRRNSSSGKNCAVLLSIDKIQSSNLKLRKNWFSSYRFQVQSQRVPSSKLCNVYDLCLGCNIRVI